MRFSRLVGSFVVTLAFASLSIAPLSAQGGTGRIIGRVVDAAQGAPIAGAQVVIPATGQSATSALDGRYSLLGVPAGAVTLSVRMIGFQPKLVSGILVPAGDVVAQNVALTAGAVELEELAVTAESERGSVNRALEAQRDAPNIVNAVTAEQISKTPDGDAGQAVQRVSGVSVQDGKYVFVRGLGERYTTTSLNGARIPSPEPERKVVPLDLFPAGMLEGITTSKTFTPDQPGDFSGASVDLKTREFPLGRVYTVSTSVGMNSAATGADIIRAPRFGTEWLGFPGERRDLPAAFDGLSSAEGLSQEQMNGLVASFNSAWAPRAATGSPNGSFSASIGGEDPILGDQLVGYLASLSYSYGQEIRDGEERALVAAGPGGFTPFNAYAGQTGRSSVLWGGLLNLSTRMGASTRLTLDNSYTRSAENEASLLAGRNEEFDTPLMLSRLTFTARSVRSSRLA
ncbi:MAG: carboxypeptidase regulatory-like domain-containing protein, partial [Gemmatimonadota bacterium]|nr:carboxypeptidase regulatory-like domain-containing protein [Gemmatimonadota bacterium]